MDTLLIIAFMVLFVLLLIIVFLLVNSMNPKVLFENAHEELSQGNVTGAIKILKKLIRKNASNLEAFNLLGLAYLKIHKYEDAISAFESILEIEPDNFEAEYNLAFALQTLGRYQEAKDHYSRAVSINPNDSDALYNLGLLLFQMKEYQQSAIMFNKALKFRPDNTIIKFYVAQCKDEMCTYDDQSCIDATLEDYMKLSGKQDLPPEFHIKLATAHAKSGNIKKAEEYCQQAISSNYEDINNYKLLSLICLVKKDFDSARSNLDIAKQLDPHDEEVYTLLKYV